MSDHTHNRIDDVRIARLRPVLPPAILIEQLPLGPAAEAFVYGARREVSAVLHGLDDRLLVVVAPTPSGSPRWNLGSRMPSCW
jgi:3-deoxy-7-phosphoheptulonate synthase